VIKEVLGVGGFGVTYLAEHEILEKRFAIKEHFPSQFAVRDSSSDRLTPTDVATYQWALDCFLREARLLARLRHPNIVVVSDVLEANNTGYMVLEYERGRSLDNWLRSLGHPPTQSELDALVPPLLAALSYIHARGLLHRDIAPDNIILREGDGSPCLIDFGAAREAVANRSQAMSAVVKPGYSPPEQYARSGKAQGPWSDIYALAATLYRAVTGKPPAEATERQLLDELKPVSETLDGEHGYRATFLAAIDAGLQLNTDERPQSVEQLWLKLTEQEAQQPSHLLERFYQRPAPVGGPPELVPEPLTLRQRLLRIVAPPGPLAGALAGQLASGRLEAWLRSNWAPVLWVLIVGVSWWPVISLIDGIGVWSIGPSLLKTSFFVVLLPLLVMWLVLPWPLLFWRMHVMHPAATLIVCLITVVHTTFAGFGIAALGFIGVTGELTNTSRVTALNCGIVGLLISIGVVAWRLNNWRTTLPKVRPVSVLAARRRLPQWHKAIFVALVALIATLVVQRYQVWLGTTLRPHLSTVEQQNERVPKKDEATLKKDEATKAIMRSPLKATEEAAPSREANALTEQLSDLARVLHSISIEGDRLRAETQRLRDARARLAALEESKRQALAERQAELTQLRQAATTEVTERHSKDLQADIDKINAERERMNARLMETAAILQQSEDQLNLVESRLRELDSQDKHLREMLEARRGSDRQIEGTLKQDEAALKKDEASAVPTPIPANP
jgi:serine/threonine protein kinase